MNVNVDGLRDLPRDDLTPEEIADIDSDCTTRDLRTGFSMHSAGDVGDPLASLDCLDEDAFGTFDD